MRLCAIPVGVCLAVPLFCAAQAGEPQHAIPDPLALVQEVEAHQRRMDQVRENFTFDELRETDDLNSRGEVTGRSSEEREVFFVNRYRIARLVKKDGKPLGAREARAEQERVTRLVEKATREPLNHDSWREGGDLELSRILAVMNASHPRRVTLNGRATLAYDFNGDRHAPAHGLALSAAKKISGTVWFDEADRQVARIEATLDDNFRVGGGLLATVQKGTWVRFEQAPAGQGLWLPTLSEYHLAARELVVKGVRQNVRIRDVNFRRFETGASGKIELR